MSYGTSKWDPYSILSEFVEPRTRGPLQRQPSEEEEEELQRQPLEVEKDDLQLQRQPGVAAKPVANGFLKAVPVMRSGGQPLSGMVRGCFELRFGTDLKGVRVHPGEVAARATAAVNAQAFTFGSTIAFARVQYEPYGYDGRKLTAHELSHVLLQQGDTIQ